MLGILISALISAGILCAIMFVVARHEADYSFPKVIMIAVGTMVCNVILGLFVNEWIASLAILALLTWALHEFCYLRWGMAALVTVIFVVVNIGLGLALAAAFS